MRGVPLLTTGLQTELDKLGDLINGTSGISLGDTAPSADPKHLIACYESNTSGYGPGTYFYGIGLVVNQAVGLGFCGWNIYGTT